MADEARNEVDGAEQRHIRVDWRTGRRMVQRGEAFWQEQERRRMELGMSVPEYCAANNLALSTYRHRVGGKKRASSTTAAASAPASPAPSFIAVTSPRADADTVVEIVLEGMTVRLCGAAADRVLDRVLARLA